MIHAVEQARLTASDGAADDGFGISVAVSGSTAVVGAASDDTPAGTDAGSAYVFVRSGTTWTEQAHLTASDGASFNYFGISVAVNEDTAVVGAYLNGTTGAAYVYVRSGTIWTEQARLAASDGAAHDEFGYSVGLSGDTAVVGAVGDDTPAGINAGSAYVFVRSGTTWTEQAHLTASDGARGNAFGDSVAVSVDTAVVGADGKNGFTGAAYVFVRSGTIWTEQASLTASDGARGDDLGYSVAVSGDTGVVGAEDDDTPAGTDAGSAYVFVRSGTTWTEQAHLTASDGVGGDKLGYSVAVSGDRAVVGAPFDDTAAGANAGSAYGFVRSGTTWTQRVHLAASDAAEQDQFGVSVALSGHTVLVGAWLHMVGGSAYVFRVG